MINTKKQHIKCRHDTGLFGFLLLFASVSFADPVPIDRVIAVVNEGVIFSNQLESRLTSVYQQMKPNAVRPSDDILRQQVLERLIVESLQLQLAERAGVTIKNEELQNALASIAHQNSTDITGLENKIEKDGLIFKAFVKNIEQEMIMQRIQQAAVSKRTNITNQDVINFLSSEEGKQRSASVYHLAHILLPVAENASNAEKSTAESQAKQIVTQARDTSSTKDFTALVREFSKAQDASTGGDLGWRKKTDLPSLYADKVDTLASGSISEPFFSGGAYHILKMLEIQGLGSQWVQQTHARHILIKPSIIRSEDETVQLLTNLRQQILDSTDFSDIAKKYSEDYGSALKGGDLGLTTPGALVPEFQQVMDATAVNNISVPFKTQYGWHIVQVLERHEQNMSDDMLKQAAHNFLLQKRFQDELPRWLKEIRDEAYVDIKSTDAKSEDLPSNPSAPVQ